MITNLERIFYIENDEYGYTGGVKPVARSSSLSLSIPKITGAISGTGTDSNNADGIFDNDPACKPSYSKKVNRKNTVTVPVERGSSWLTTINSGGNIPKGTQFTVRFLNGNPQKPILKME